jgi:hypothetical protein
MDPCLRRDPIKRSDAEADLRRWHAAQIGVPAQAGAPLLRRSSGCTMDPCLRRDPTNARGNSRFLRRQEPISPAKERLQDGSLPSPGSGKRAGQFEVPAKAGTHCTGERAVAGWIPAFAGIRQTRGAIRGSCAGRNPFRQRSSGCRMDPCLRRDPINARGNSRFLRRQEPISPAKERLQDGSLPA